MNPTCNIVAERVALGEPLGEYAARPCSPGTRASEFILII
ncbi:hypothetical protein BH11MYX2_BH11MYX2_13070 [soil metagenome]